MEYSEGMRSDRTCPNCDEAMVVYIRRADGRKFLGCPNWPDCKYTESLIEDTRPPAPFEVNGVTFNLPDSDTALLYLSDDNSRMFALAYVLYERSTINEDGVSDFRIIGAVERTPDAQAFLDGKPCTYVKLREV